MSTTAAPAPATRCAPVAAPEPGGEEVLGLGAAATLAFVVERRRRQDVAAAEELRAVAAWADHHRADGVGAVDGSVADLLGARVDGDLLGLEGELRLAGEGTFTVTEFAVSELAAALGMSERTARAYAGQAIELRDRLPRLWARTMAVEIPAWKARRVATETIALSAAATDEVDRQLAPFAHRLSLTRILACVEAAVLRHDPDLAAERAAAAAEKRGVWVEDHLDGTSSVTAVTGTPDAAAFDTALSHVAHDLAALGDTDTDQVRRAKAVGVLADPQYALDLHTHATDPGGADAGSAPPRAASASRGGPTVHIHLHADAVETRVGTARVTRLGARSVAAVQQWLTDLAPGAAVTITPVVDLGEHLSVDAYEVPDRLRRQVDERDHGGCRFPWCGRQGRFDVDHIEPYLPPDEGGPPGQTNTANTAKLCRFHHRVKTHDRWTYVRTGPTEVTWTSPLGRRYTVDEHGTYPRS